MRVRVPVVLPRARRAGRTAGDEARVAGLVIGDDPASWREFVTELVDRHGLAQPGAGADQRSCGRAFMLCPIAPSTNAMVEHRPRVGKVGSG